MYNPLEQTSIPKARTCGDTYAYSLDEIDAMLATLPELAATVVATAAFTGARRGEIRAMTWENYDGAQLLIAQSNWQGHITEPKTKKSKAPIPIIKQLALRLELHREQQGKPKTGPIFRTAANTAQDLDSVLRRTILPVLNRCGVCKKAKAEHGADADHQYEREPCDAPLARLARIPPRIGDEPLPAGRR
jgi:integrase